MAQPNLTLSGPPPPQRLGRYLLGRELGRGFSSVVYDASDPLRNRRVALKVLTFLQNLSPGRRRDMAERFEREARAISTLSHPSIIAIYEVGHAEDGRQFIAMEHLEGETLRARIERAGPLPPAKALELIVQIADALQYAHGRGIVHRDVKPDNVFVCPDGTAKLMDFGVAHVFADDGLTQTGTVVGSPAYMSPEQINGRRLDGRSDVFSLAITLAEALTGRKPFEAPNIPAVMNQILHRPPQISGIQSRALRRVVGHALAKNPQARVPSPAAFAAELRRIEPSLPPASSVLTASPQATTIMPLPRPPVRRTTRPTALHAVGVGALVLGLAALAIVPFTQHRHPVPPASTPKDHAYRISTEWRRATDAHRPRRHQRAATFRTPSLADGEGRIIETFAPPPHQAPDTPTPETQEVLRMLRDQSPPTRLAEPHTARPPALRAAAARPPKAPLPPRQPAVPLWPPIRVLATYPRSVAAAPPAPVVRVARSSDSSSAPAAVAPPATPTVSYPYGTGPAPAEDSQTTSEPDMADTRPRLLRRTALIYPRDARDRSETGTVRLRVYVNEDGDVYDAAVIQSSGSPDLDDAAIRTVMGWKYDPALHDGHAVPAPVHEVVHFGLD